MIAKTIDEVIAHLEQIIQTSKAEESIFGYFAALYQKVTIRVKEKLNTNYFDDDERMERLDVLFANRYLAAYSAYKKGEAVTQSWKDTFHAASDHYLIVLQHLLLGMNAHINLDLGIAAAEIAEESGIHSLQSDFNKINDILASLVDEIQQDLARIWPTLLWILKKLKKTDDFLINFSMKIARDGAWKFANELVVEKEKPNKANLVIERDACISALSKKITVHKMLVRVIFKIIRLSERGKPSDKIDALRKVIA